MLQICQFCLQQGLDCREMLHLQQSTGRTCYSGDSWHSFEFSVKWQSLKCILISFRSAKCYGLLHWDCLCHFHIFPLSHETTSYLFHSKSVNIIVSKSQHVSFKGCDVPENAQYFHPTGERCLFRPQNEIQIINSRRQEDEDERVKNWHSTTNTDGASQGNTAIKELLRARALRFSSSMQW